MWKRLLSPQTALRLWKSRVHTSTMSTNSSMCVRWQFRQLAACCPASMLLSFTDHVHLQWKLHSSNTENQIPNSLNYSRVDVSLSFCASEFLSSPRMFAFSLYFKRWQTSTGWPKVGRGDEIRKFAWQKQLHDQVLLKSRKRCFWFAGGVIRLMIGMMTITITCLMWQQLCFLCGRVNVHCDVQVVYDDKSALFLAGHILSFLEELHSPSSVRCCWIAVASPQKIKKRKQTNLTTRNGMNK